MLKSVIRSMNPAASIQEEQLYERAKEHDRKHQSFLPRIIQLSGDDSGVSLPLRHRASSIPSPTAGTESSSRSSSVSQSPLQRNGLSFSSTTGGTEASSRDSSASQSQEPADVHTGFYRVLQDMVEVCGVERSNEIRRCGREYNAKQSQVRAARRALAEKAPGEGVIWKNAEDLVSQLSHVVYDRDENFGLYHNMLSMRMSYNPYRSSLSDSAGPGEPDVFAQGVLSARDAASGNLPGREGCPPLPPHSDVLDVPMVPARNEEIVIPGRNEEIVIPARNEEVVIPARNEEIVIQEPQLIEPPRLRHRAPLVLGHQGNTHEVTIPKELNATILHSTVQPQDVAHMSIRESIQSELSSTDASPVREGSVVNCDEREGSVVIPDEREGSVVNCDEREGITTDTLNQREGSSMARTPSVREDTDSPTSILLISPLSDELATGNVTTAAAASPAPYERLQSFASAKSEPLQTASPVSPVIMPPMRRPNTLTSDGVAGATNMERPRMSLSMVTGEQRACIVVRQISNDEIDHDFLPVECSSDELDSSAEDLSLEMDNDMTLLPQPRSSAGKSTPAVAPTNMLSASSAFSRSRQNVSSTPSEASHEGERKRGAPNGSESDQMRISLVMHDLDANRESSISFSELPVCVDSDSDSELSDLIRGNR